MNLPFVLILPPHDEADGGHDEADERHGGRNEAKDPDHLFEY